MSAKRLSPDDPLPPPPATLRATCTATEGSVEVFVQLVLRPKACPECNRRKVSKYSWQERSQKNSCRLVQFVAKKVFTIPSTSPSTSSGQALRPFDRAQGRLRSGERSGRQLSASLHPSSFIRCAQDATRGRAAGTFSRDLEVWWAKMRDEQMFPDTV